MRQSKDNFSGESTRKTGRWKIVLTVFILIAVILTAVVLVLFFRNDGSSPEYRFWDWCQESLYKGRSHLQDCHKAR